MKQTLITLLFLCSLSAQMIAQQKYTVTDTTYTTNSAGVFFTVRDIVYSNGEETHTKTRIGDTLALFDAFYNRFVNTAAQMSTDARYAITFPALIGDMNRDNNLLLATTGKDALDTVTARLSAPLLEDGWTLRTSGAGAEDVVFVVNNNGQLRYTITGFTTRNATLFGQVIRLNNFKDGTAIYLYQVASGNYKTIDNSITLRRPGGPANRSVTAPPPDPDTILAEPKNGTPVTPVKSATPAKAGGTGTKKKTPAIDYAPGRILTPALMCFMAGAAYDDTTKGKIFKGSLVVSAGLSLTIGGKRKPGELLWQIGAGIVGFGLGSLYKAATGP